MTSKLSFGGNVKDKTRKRKAFNVPTYNVPKTEGDWRKFMVDMSNPPKPPSVEWYLESSLRTPDIDTTYKA